jgi:transposase
MATYGIKDIQERYGVGEHTVLGWIHRGELKALNCARKLGTRPKYRITQAALDAFEALRETATTQPTTSGRRKPKSNVIEFFK